MKIPRDRSTPTTPLDSLTAVPAMVGWLGVLIIAGSLAAASVNVLPYWPIEHKGVNWVIAAVMLPIGVVMWLIRSRAPHWVVHAGLLVGVSCITWSVWAAGPTAESQAAALFYGFLSAFASAFLVRRQAVAYITLAGVLYLGALLTHWRQEMVTQWTMNMFAIAVPFIVIGTLVGRLRLLALHDTLTGLPNRRLLEEILPVRSSMSRRDGRGFAVVAIDLDGLKRVNDTEGHAAGDRLLQSAAAGWTSALRAGDSLARVGGDEFVLVLSDIDLTGAMEAVERLRDAAPHVKFSAGVVCWTGQAIGELLRRADAGLYAAKKMGGGITVSDPTAASQSSGAANSGRATY
ncbi:MAG TPA: GGDEF domain-containing protein [Acidothermaceae bacterium]|nr:GGDEF domain-containing protein [Acidothermaceae bacterium]